MFLNGLEQHRSCFVIIMNLAKPLSNNERNDDTEDKFKDPVVAFNAHMKKIN